MRKVLYILYDITLTVAVLVCGVSAVWLAVSMVMGWR